jgi:hypothetical protein
MRPRPIHWLSIEDLKKEKEEARELAIDYLEDLIGALESKEDIKNYLKGAIAKIRTFKAIEAEIERKNNLKIK